MRGAQSNRTNFRRSAARHISRRAAFRGQVLQLYERSSVATAAMRRLRTLWDAMTMYWFVEIGLPNYDTK